MDLVFIRKAEFELSIGVTEEERSRPQRVAISAEIGIGRWQGGPHELSATVDYSEVHRLLGTHLGARSWCLVEEAAEYAAQLILTSFPPAQRVRIELRKFVLPGTSSAGAVVERSRRENAPAQRVLLELHVPDFAAALAFYSLLGFEEARRDSSYLVLRRGESVLCFYGGSEEVFRHSYFGRFPRASKRGYGVEIILFESDVRRSYEELQGKITIAAPLTLRPWGKWDFRVEDPFGYYLRLSEPYDVISGE